MIWAWTFFWYVSPQGNCVKDEMDVLVQDALLAQLRRQRTVSHLLWKGMVKQLHGDRYRFFHENLIAVNDVQHRPMGFMGPHRQQYTVLAYATHKQRRYDPPGVFGTLNERRKLVEQYGECKRVIKLD